MAQRFSKKFYNSKEWQKIRENILKRDNYLCQVCGMPAEEIHHKIKLTPQNINNPNVSMAEDNLTSLCRDCHFNEHKKDRGELEDVEEGYAFDCNGMLVEL